MIEVRMLHHDEWLAVWICLPGCRFPLIYHTRGILLSQPFRPDSVCLKQAPWLFVEMASTAEELLGGIVVSAAPLLPERGRLIGMRGEDALAYLQKTTLDR